MLCMQGNSRCSLWNRSYINSLCGQNVEFTFKPGVRQSNREALKDWNVYFCCLYQQTDQVLLRNNHCLQHLQHFAVCCIFAVSRQTGVPVIFSHVNVTRNRKVVFVHLSVRSHISVCEALRRTSTKFSTEGIVRLRTGYEDSDGE
jgi:hypothetical protein